MPISSDDAKASAGSKAVSGSAQEPIVGDTERSHVLAQLLAYLKPYQVPSLAQDLDDLVEKVVQAVQRKMTAQGAEKLDLGAVIADAVRDVGTVYFRAYAVDRLKAGPPKPSAPPVETQAAQAHDDPMEKRIARLEASVEHIQRDAVEIKGDVRAMRGDFQSLHGEVSAVKSSLTAVHGDVRALQSDAGAIRSDLRAVQDDMRLLRENLRTFGVDVNAEFRELRKEMAGTTWRILCAFGAGFAILIGLILSK